VNYAYPSQALFIITRRLLTIIRGVLETSVGDERDSSMKTFCISQTFHDHVHFFAPQLILNAFQRPFERKPKIDLLGCGARRDIAIKLGHCLDGLDPCIDMRMQGIEESAIV